MRLGTLIRIVLTPGCWIRNDRHSPQVTQYLNEMMDQGIPFVEGYCTGSFKGYDLEIWVANYPYAYGSFRRRGSERLPNRETVFRLHDYIHGTHHWTSKITLQGMLGAFQ